MIENTVDDRLAKQPPLQLQQQQQQGGGDDGQTAREVDKMARALAAHQGVALKRLNRRLVRSFVRSLA